MINMNYLIGVDAGTTSFKAALCSADGRIVSIARREYALLALQNQVEYPPEQYWALFCAVVQDLFSLSGVSPHDVAALAISSQGETFICVDEEGNSIGNAIVWLDNRSVHESARLQAMFTLQELYSHTGQYGVQPTWTATKLMWMQKHQPERMKRVHKFLLLEDYLVFRLTGRYVCERTLPSSTLLYDIPTGNWWQDMLRITGIRENQLPELIDSAEPVGPVTRQAAQQSGLSTHTLITGGAFDQIATMVGSGNIRHGMITEVTGSCLVVDTVSSQFSPYSSNYPLTCQPFCIPGSYILMLFSNTAGMALKWFRDCMYPDQSMSYALLCEEASKMPPGSDGLIMLPHLAGAQFPQYNANAKGVFYGATLAHRRGHFVRSILEAVAYIQRSMLELLDRSGYGSDEVVSLGGASTSGIWNQIKADITGRQIMTISTGEPASVGAAALAGVGYGLFSDLGQACNLLVRSGNLYTPDTGYARVYDELYTQYRRLDERISIPDSFADYGIIEGALNGKVG